MYNLVYNLQDLRFPFAIETKGFFPTRRSIRRPPFPPSRAFGFGWRPPTVKDADVLPRPHTAPGDGASDFGFSALPFAALERILIRTGSQAARATGTDTGAETAIGFCRSQSRAARCASPICASDICSATSRRNRAASA